MVESKERERKERKAYNQRLQQARAIARAALAYYGWEAAQVRLLAHRWNTLFRVEAPPEQGGGRFVLRVYEPGGPADARIRSELAWLAALRRDTTLGVPEPIPAGAGSLLTVVAAPDGGESRRCVLFRWVAGRFVDQGLTPMHLERVGAFLAGLHSHAAQWTPPSDFTRRHWDWRALFAPGAVADPDGGAGSLAPADRAIFAAAAERIAADMSVLEQSRAEYGLIHADFQQTNYLFHQGTVRAIDFADCCWGYYTYDMAIALFEVADRPRGAAMRAAFLNGYARVRALPPQAEAQIRLFTAIRLIKRVNYLAQVDNPTLSAQTPYWISYTVDWLRRFLGDGG